MKKATVFLLTAALALSLFTACGGGQNGGASGSGASTPSHSGTPYVDGVLLANENHYYDGNPQDNIRLTLQTDAGERLQFYYEADGACAWWAYGYHDYLYMVPEGSRIRVYYAGAIIGEDTTGAYPSTMECIEEDRSGESAAYMQEIWEETFLSLENPMVVNYEEALLAVISQMGYEEYQRAVTPSGMVYYVIEGGYLTCFELPTNTVDGFAFIVYKMEELFKHSEKGRYIVIAQTGEVIDWT